MQGLKHGRPSISAEPYQMRGYVVVAWATQTRSAARMPTGSRSATLCPWTCDCHHIQPVL